MLIDAQSADRYTGYVLLALGSAMLAGGYSMDRLEIRQIHPASIPGLVPMALGGAMIVCALLLILSARRQSTDGLQTDDGEADPGSYKNLLITAFLSVAYAGGLVGNIPFAVATASYIFLFTTCFTWPADSTTLSASIKRIGLIAVFACVFSTGISMLFQYGFLVRLP